MTTRKFYRRTFTVEVVSDQPISPDAALGDIALRISEGPDYGRITEGLEEVLNGQQAALALLAQGVDPASSLFLDSSGNDIEEDEGRLCDDDGYEGDSTGTRPV